MTPLSLPSIFDLEAEGELTFKREKFRDLATSLKSQKYRLKKRVRVTNDRWFAHLWRESKNLFRIDIRRQNVEKTA